MKVLLLNGSLRAGSVNGAALRTVQDVAPAGMEVQLYAGMADLPHFNPDDDRDPLPLAVTQLREAVAAAHALIICTPEYAGALPGAFKNLLDWLVGSTVMHEKPVAWVNVSTSPNGAADAHQSLGLVLRYLNATVEGHACAAIPVPRQLIGPDGLIHDAKVREKLTNVLGFMQRFHDPTGRVWALVHMDSPDQEVIRCCLEAVLSGIFIDAAEFETISGAPMYVLHDLLHNFPNSDDSRESAELALHGAFMTLTGYPHHQEARWDEFIPVPPHEVERVHLRWMKRKGWEAPAAQGGQRFFDLLR